MRFKFLRAVSKWHLPQSFLDYLETDGAISEFWRSREQGKRIEITFFTDTFTGVIVGESPYKRDYLVWMDKPHRGTRLWYAAKNLERKDHYININQVFWVFAK